MKTTIIHPTHPELKKYIQYFILFNAENTANVNYTTFPNTNLCLSIYKHNTITVETKKNGKHLSTKSGTSSYTSYLSGFHDSTLNVNINASIDEICILFHPSALRIFSNCPYNELLQSDQVFQDVFPLLKGDFIERLFDEPNNHKRILMLEQGILKCIKNENPSPKVNELLHLIASGYDWNVATLAQNLAMNESTLYRLFINQIGQSPKAYLRTVRFRKALNSILRLEKLTDIAYQNNYTDQSHFIRDFKAITGESPHQLRNKTSIQQEQLAWIYAQQ